MNIDDLISGALEDKGGMIDASNLFALVGDPTTEELFVLNLENYFLENLKKFQDEHIPGTILLGAYTTEEGANRSIDSIRESGKLEGSDLIMHPDWVILLGNISHNSLFSMPLIEYYIGYFSLFGFKTSPEIVPIAIVENPEAAERMIEIIRAYIKA